jgi:hypothetical protein
VREDDPVIVPVKFVNFGLVAIEIGRDLNQKPGDQVHSDVKLTWSISVCRQKHCKRDRFNHRVHGWKTALSFTTE